MFPAFRAEGDAKEAILKKVAEEKAPVTLKYLARLLEKRGGEHFAGNEVLSNYHFKPLSKCARNRWPYDARFHAMFRHLWHKTHGIKRSWQVGIGYHRR